MKNITEADLAMFTGTSRYYRLMPNHLLTEGDLPPPSRTKVMAVGPQILENCGYEDNTIYR